MLADDDGRSLAAATGARIDEAGAAPADRSMAIIQWTMAAAAAVAAILLASVR